MTNPEGYTALGFVGFTDKGTYDPTYQYAQNDLAHRAGSIWKCLIDNTQGITPTEGTNWTLFMGEPTNMAEKIIAPLEDSPSESSYSVGQQLIFNDNLYEAIRAIAIGDTLVTYESDPTNANIKLAPKVASQIQTLTNNVSANAVAIAKCEMLEINVPSFSALPLTITNSDIEDDMKVANSVLSNTSAQTGDWTVVTSNGSLTISGSISGTTTATLYLLKTR